MAVNVDLFNAAFMGAVSGAFNSFPTDTVAADYAAIVTACAAFATAVDAIIPLDAALVSPVDTTTLKKTTLMQSICLGVMSKRYPLSSSSATYANLAAGVKALYTQSLTALA